MPYKQLPVNFLESLKSSDKEYCVVFVGSTTCRPCKQFEPIFNTWADTFAVHADFYKGLIDNEALEIAEKYDVTKVPSFLVLKKDGTLVRKFVGADGETMIRNVLNEIFVKTKISDDF